MDDFSFIHHLLSIYPSIHPSNKYLTSAFHGPCPGEIKINKVHHLPLMIPRSLIGETDRQAITILSVKYYETAMLGVIKMGTEDEFQCLEGQGRHSVFLIMISLF